MVLKELGWVQNLGMSHREQSQKTYSTRTPAEVGICGSIMTSHSAATDIAQVRNDARTK